jgi:hypothetical protein
VVVVVEIVTIVLLLLLLLLLPTTIVLINYDDDDYYYYYYYYYYDDDDYYYYYYYYYDDDDDAENNNNFLRSYTYGAKSEYVFAMGDGSMATYWYGAKMDSKSLEIVKKTQLQLVTCLAIVQACTGRETSATS